MGVNAEFQERAAAAVERAAPGSIYKAAPIKGFHRMYALSGLSAAQADGMCTFAFQ